ncbi:MAG: hypothetical protein ACJ780_25385 [Solirubrobacteraceae bacterium]
MASERDDAEVETAAIASGPGARSTTEQPTTAPLAQTGRGRFDGRADAQSILALQRLVGNRAAARAVQRSRGTEGAGRRWLSRLGYKLWNALPAGAPTPVEDHAPDQRKWNKSDFYTFWETEQGRKLRVSEKRTIDRGCIGITANNLEGEGDPSLDEVYDSFNAAYAAMDKHNHTWWNEHISSTKYVLFGMLFWSNQDPDESKRVSPDPAAFRGDPKTHRVDMSNYKYYRQPGKTNFDYGFWDQATLSFWHANHKDTADNPMIVYQSTKEKFAYPFTMPDGTERYGYPDFDRAVYGVAVANNYDPTKARAL